MVPYFEKFIVCWDLKTKSLTSSSSTAFCNFSDNCLIFEISACNLTMPSTKILPFLFLGLSSVWIFLNSTVSRTSSPNLSAFSIAYSSLDLFFLNSFSFSFRSMLSSADTSSSIFSTPMLSFKFSVVLFSTIFWIWDSVKNLNSHERSRMA